MSNVSADDLKSWAQGQLSNTMTEGDDGGDDASETDDGEGDGEGGGSRNALWAGEYDGDVSTISPEQADELLGFLETEEPEIFSAVVELAAALEGGEEGLEAFEGSDADVDDDDDDDEPDGGGQADDDYEGGDPVEHAKQELLAATQRLNPEYPHMDEAQKEKASKYIGEELESFGHPAKDSADWKQAVAIGLSRAREG